MLLTTSLITRKVWPKRDIASDMPFLHYGNDKFTVLLNPGVQH